MKGLLSKIRSWWWVGVLVAIVVALWSWWQGASASRLRQKALQLEQEKEGARAEAVGFHIKANTAIRRGIKAQEKASNEIRALEKQGHGTVANIVDRVNRRGGNRLRDAEPTSRSSPKA